MYNSCEVISSHLPLYLEQGKCIDQHWWHRVLQLKTEGKTRYPLLKRLVSALLSIFTGPLVEATFNIMDDIVENDRTMLTSENYEAVALIKSGLRADKKDSTTMPITHKMRKTCTSAYSAYKEFLETKKLQKEELKQKRIQAALHNLGRKTQKDKSQTREFNRVQKIGDKAKQSRNPVPVNKSTAHPTSDSSNKPKRYVIPKVQSTDNSESAPCVSRATDRESYFKTIAGKLQKASKKSFYQLQELAKEVEKDIDKWPVSCVQGLDASHYSTDEKAADLFPKDAPALLPISIEGDGNCLPRCAALLATGSEKAHVEMRVRIIVELAVNEQYYLNDENLKKQYSGTAASSKWSKLYATHSYQLGQEELHAEGIQKVFQKEVVLSTPSGAFMGSWHLHAVASILHTTIQTVRVYPEYGGHTVRHCLQRLIAPRLPSPGGDSRPQTIMWSRALGKDLPEKLWRPNHFVVCLPEKRQQLKRKSGPSDIRQFFVKKARKDSVP
ncbi:hypothetical protein ACOMHN_048861 [Nucella lapillus]